MACFQDTQRQDSGRPQERCDRNAEEDPPTPRGNLCTTVTRPKEQNEFRCLVTCMLTVREIKEDELCAKTLSRLMADTGNRHLSKIFTGKPHELKAQDIQAFAIAYKSLARAPPPPPPSGGPPLPPGGA